MKRRMKRKMDMKFNVTVDKKKMETIMHQIIQLEKKNMNSHEMKDAEMIKKICKIIEQEVDR